ncbi:hypothetical protein FHETE_10901 [Fusarium heterosporum]|uniref:Uncharacterized protein n=1 Tax=Fusarium heterosporum TaxID=42747 RepID=A0A8H5WFL5_FUSHE|nr:hypothetical protein FHETE_10901 [Fusarium heterosporum]
MPQPVMEVGDTQRKKNSRVTVGCHDEQTDSPSSAPITRLLRDSSELYQSPTSPYSRPALPFTAREAVLIRNFAENMALWADATDPKRHFELEVPRRSMYFPVLRYAVFAFSSRHVNRDKSDTSTEALEYYDYCLSLLIEAVGESDGAIDEETLAAIAILRQYEEMDGTSRIVNSMSLFDFNGGLGEAAAWLCLRQDIYVSLTKQRPLRSDLETYVQSDVFSRVDDAAYANKMVFLLARALSCVFPSDLPSSSERLECIRLEVDGWYDSKPTSFNSIFETSRDKDEGRLLPEIWVLSPFHANCTESPPPGRSTGELARKSRKRSFHSSSFIIGGSVFTEIDDQEMVLTFLEHVQQKTGWYSTSLSSTLKQQWSQDAIEEH